MINPVRIFLAGATGAVGRSMCRMLDGLGYEVFGMTRSPEKAAFLEALHVTPVIADVYDAERVASLLAAIRPQIVVHQLTDLPYGLPPDKMAEGRQNNTRIRDVGTRHLVQAGRAAGVVRFIVQSIAFAYAPGPLPHTEADPLASEALRAFEQQVLDGPFEGIVLRYGQFYGPGTGAERVPDSCIVHVDAAAHAAVLALSRGRRGVYNIAEDSGVVSSDKAIRELGWDAAFRNEAQ